MVGSQAREGEGHGEEQRNWVGGTGVLWLPLWDGHPAQLRSLVSLQAQAICLHPLYVMLPCTLASSLAFMLPVATPPNAIVFSYGGLKVYDMVSVREAQVPQPPPCSICPSWWPSK